MNKQIKRYLTITLGTCISGIALNAFFLPHHLLSGGITGLGMILFYLFGWQVSVTNIIFNIPLFFLAYKLMSRNYFISGIYGTLVLSFFLQLFAPLQRHRPEILQHQHRHYRIPDQHRAADGRRVLLRTGTGPVHFDRVFHRI